MIRADLHIHTYYSDGGQSPADVVNAAKARGVGLIAVTDHDNTQAFAEVEPLARAAGVKAILGEEVSAYSGDVKVHVLCYGEDALSPRFIKFHKKIYDGAEERTADILKKLAAAGVKISYGDVLRERKSPLSPLHAMYIAAAGARKGYAGSPVDFYMRYLNFGRAGFSRVGRPTPAEAIENAVACGGLCSLAHPGRISLGREEVVKLLEGLICHGLSGIEAVYSGHTDGETQYYKELAEKYSLYVTGGSDTHFSEGNKRVGFPEFYPDAKLLSALKII